jgi:hypothetical protein
MITKSIYRYIFVPLFTISLIACEKEARDTEKTDPTAEVTIEFLVELANKRFMEEEVTTGEKVNDTGSEIGGIIGEYTATREDFSTDRARRNDLLSCLVSVDPDNEQRQLIGRSLSVYSGRNERIISSYRQDMQNLHQRMENARKELYEKFRNEEIDREQLLRRLTDLNKRYREAVYNIRHKNSESFSRSYTILLEQLKEILYRDQWRAFTACMSSQNLHGIP